MFKNLKQKIRYCQIYNTCMKKLIQQYINGHGKVERRGYKKCREKQEE